MLRDPPGPSPADVAAVLLTRLDGLLVDLDPSAIMVHGGGMTAVVAAQVAFWRQIPVVHLQAAVRLLRERAEQVVRGAAARS